MPSTANLTPAASILSTERVVATLTNGDTVGVLASGLPVSTAQTAAFVGLTGNQTVAGVKTFSSPPVAGGVQLSTTSIPASAVAQIRWNDTDKCPEFETEGGVMVQLGQETLIYARNVSGVSEPNGAVVMLTGSSGQRATVALAQANAVASAQGTIGVVTTSAGIANNAFGFVTTQGLVRELDTSGFTEGAEVWLSAATPGVFTATKPSTEGQYVVRVGFIVRAHATQGMLYVQPLYHGSVTGDAVSSAVSKAAARTAIDAAADDLSNAEARSKVENYQLWQLQNWWDALYRVTTESARANLIVWGDSVAPGKIEPQYMRLWRAYGFGGYMGPNAAYGGSSSSFSGGAAYYNSNAGSQNPETCVYWPAARYYTLPSGGTITRGLFSFPWTTRYLKIYYFSETGGGVFKVQARTSVTDWADVSGASSIDASTNSGAQALTLDLGSAQRWAYRVVGISGGTTKIADMGLFNTTGVAVYELHKGGTRLSDQVTWAPANYNVFLPDMDTSLLYTEMKIEIDQDPSYLDQLADFETIFATAGVSDRMSLLYVGSTQEPTTDAEVAQNNAMRDTASLYGRAFWNPANTGVSMAALVRAYGSKFTISSITRSGSTATVTTSSPHGGSTGFGAYISGAVQSEYNGLKTMTVTGASTFTFPVTGTPATPATALSDGLLVAVSDTTHLYGSAQNAWADQLEQQLRFFGAVKAKQPDDFDVVNGTIRTDLIMPEGSLRTRLLDTVKAGKRQRRGLTYSANYRDSQATVSALSTGDFTVSFWCYVPTLAQSVSSRGWWSFGPSAGATAFYCWHDFGTDELRFTLSGATGSDTRSKCLSGFQAAYGGSWRQITVRRVAALADLLVDVDGVPQGSNYSATLTYFDRTSGTAPAWTGTISATTFFLGAAVANQATSITFAEIGLWTSALTDAALLSYTTTGLPPDSAALLLRFSECVGLTAFDSSGNGRNLTFTASLWTFPSPNEFTGLFTLDFPSIAANGGIQDLTGTLTGLVAGDQCVVTRADGTLPNAGITLYAQGTAANTFTVRATNTTASPIDPASASYRVTAKKY